MGRKSRQSGSGHRHGRRGPRLPPRFPAQSSQVFDGFGSTWLNGGGSGMCWATLPRMGDLVGLVTHIATEPVVAAGVARVGDLHHGVDAVIVQWQHRNCIVLDQPGARVWGIQVGVIDLKAGDVGLIEMNFTAPSDLTVQQGCDRDALLGLIRLADHAGVRIDLDRLLAGSGLIPSLATVRRGCSRCNCWKRRDRAGCYGCCRTAPCPGDWDWCRAAVTLRTRW